MPKQSPVQIMAMAHIGKSGSSGGKLVNIMIQHAPERNASTSWSGSLGTCTWQSDCPGKGRTRRRHHRTGPPQFSCIFRCRIHHRFDQSSVVSLKLKSWLLNSLSESAALRASGRGIFINHVNIGVAFQATKGQMLAAWKNTLPVLFGDVAQSFSGHFSKGNYWSCCKRRCSGKAATRRLRTVGNCAILWSPRRGGQGNPQKTPSSQSSLTRQA